MKLKMKMTQVHAGLTLGALVALVGCGGGGQTGSPISGKLMDGYIKGAVVCLDVNQNLKCDAGEPATKTGSGGDFTLYPLKDTALGGLPLVAEIGTDAEDADAPGQAMDATRMLGSAEKPAVISPLTTVVASLVLRGASPTDAEASARTLLGLPGSFDFSIDYIKAGDVDTHKLAQAVNTVVTSAVGDSVPNPSTLLSTLTAVRDLLRQPAADLQAALNQLFNTEDVLVGDFDGTSPTFGDIGGATVTAASAPEGGSGKALKILRATGSESFAGTAVDFAKGVTGSQYYSVSARVYVDAAAAGKPIKLKLESANGSMQSDEIESGQAVVAGWQTLTWVFNTSPGRTFNKMIVLPNVGTAGSGENFYLDDIKLYKGRVLANFDAFTPGWFGSNGSAVVTKDVGPTGGSGNAMKVVKNAPDAWAGAAVNLDAPLRNATSYTVTARVYSPTAGVPMTMKLQNFNNDSQAVQASAKQAVVQGWQTLTWEFNGATDWWWLEKLYFQPNDGAPGTGEVYYIDDIKARVSTVQLANFDNVVPSWFGASGSATVISANGPDGGVGNALEVVKNPGDTWAGAAFNLNRVIKDATSYTLRARVYSPAAGKTMVVKLVNLQYPDDRFVQASSKEPVVAGWQTLTWELTGATDWWWLEKLYFQPNDGSPGTGEVYYLDEVVLLTN